MTGCRRVADVYGDRYGSDVLGADSRAGAPSVQTVEARNGLVIECAATGWCGAVVGWQRGADGWAVLLEDRHGTRRPFGAGGSFLIDGRLVLLARPRSPSASTTTRTASGSVRVRAAVPGLPSRRGSGSRAGTMPSWWRGCGVPT